MLERGSSTRLGWLASLASSMGDSASRSAEKGRYGVWPPFAPWAKRMEPTVVAFCSQHMANSLAFFFFGVLPCLRITVQLPFDMLMLGPICLCSWIPPSPLGHRHVDIPRHVGIHGAGTCEPMGQADHEPPGPALCWGLVAKLAFCPVIWSWGNKLCPRGPQWVNPRPYSRRRMVACLWLAALQKSWSPSTDHNVIRSILYGGRN